MPYAIQRRCLPSCLDRVLRRTGCTNHRRERVYDTNVPGAWLIQTDYTQFVVEILPSVFDGLIQFLTDRNKQLASGNR